MTLTGDLGISSSMNSMMILCGPATLGKYVHLKVPSPLSLTLQSISSLVSSLTHLTVTAGFFTPASFVKTVNSQGWPEREIKGDGIWQLRLN